MASRKNTSHESVPRRRWRIAALLGFGILVSYFDRVNLSVSKEALHDAFGMTAVVFGFLSSAYNWPYAALQLPCGLLLDRFGVRRVGIVSTIIWTIASFAAALSIGVKSLFGARLLLGIGEAPTFPGTSKATGYWFPKDERSLATAMFDSMAKFSSAIGIPALGLVLVHFGWRANFALTGIISVVYFTLFYAFYRNPSQDIKLSVAEREYIRRGGAQPEDPQRAAAGAPLGYLISRKKVIGLAIGYGSYNYVFYLLLTWLPAYLAEAQHLDLTRSFLYTSVPWLCATAGELMVGGWLTDSLIQRGWNATRVRQFVLVGGTSVGLCIFGVPYAHTAQAAVMWIAFALTGLSIAAPVGWSIPSLIAPRESVGTVGGIMNLSNQLSGIAAPIVTGFIVAATKNFQWAFLAAAVYLTIGIASYIFLLGEITPIPEPEEARQ
ncbi:MAG: MFS transporter [Acidobacteria bacterium]|nr:MFS transporter [Acidobacteriota bacterium]MBS1864937.1 MFS transporter [Acidobacteriota bacterium]